MSYRGTYLSNPETGRLEYVEYVGPVLITHVVKEEYDQGTDYWCHGGDYHLRRLVDDTHDPVEATCMECLKAIREFGAVAHDRYCDLHFR